MSKPAAAKPTTGAAAGPDLDAHSQLIIDVRMQMKTLEDARQKSDFGKADTIRERLQALGVEVKYQLSGPSGWRFTDGRSNKLPAGVKQTQIPKDAQKVRAAPGAVGNRDGAKSNKELRREGREREREGQGQAGKGGKGEAQGAKGEGKKRTRDDEAGGADKGPDASGSKKAKIEGKGQGQGQGQGQAPLAKAPPAAKATPTKDTPDQLRNKAALSQIMDKGGSNTRNVQGVLIEDLLVGSGATAESGKKVKMGYVGRLKSTGKVFDASGQKPFLFRLGRSEVIKGWDIGVAGMKEGGKRRLTIPPEKGYGRSGAPPTIPSNATLIFEVTLMAVM